ncbi:hypothetical protein O7599_26805 [Streptomyces sp. WMMC500]|uniref:hypothetical protein n=1 Tax=Streptomyces sp. WMMC500 TaxID=3015154 RepID=UPI00248B26BA|nr:hypothetical protein [Streptomyces sp. WMMC500]WBB59170.1 hypothetical protein O7599_26805 [Streptomyces sp. WMMC500]
MRADDGGQGTLDAFESEALTLGYETTWAEDFRRLFLGPAVTNEPVESTEDRAARLAAADDVFAELQEQGAGDEVARSNARYAARLRRYARARRWTPRPRRAA